MTQVKVGSQTREVVFDHFVADAVLTKLPAGVTGLRLRQIKDDLINSESYGLELLHHGLAERTVYKLRSQDTLAYVHLKSNFWTMVIAMVSGITKK